MGQACSASAWAGSDLACYVDRAADHRMRARPEWPEGTRARLARGESRRAFRTPSRMTDSAASSARTPLALSEADGAALKVERPSPSARERGDRQRPPDHHLARFPPVDLDSPLAGQAAGLLKSAAHARVRGGKRRGRHAIVCRGVRAAAGEGGLMREVRRRRRGREEGGGGRRQVHVVDGGRDDDRDARKVGGSILLSGGARGGGIGRDGRDRSGLGRARARYRRRRAAVRSHEPPG